MSFIDLSQQLVRGAGVDPEAAMAIAEALETPHRLAEIPSVNKLTQLVLLLVKAKIDKAEARKALSWIKHNRPPLH